MEVRKTPWRLIAVGTAVIAAGAAVLGGLGTPILFPGRPPSVVRVTTTPPNGVLPTFDAPDIAVSADGSRIAYGTIEQGTRAVYVRSLDQFDAIRIPSAARAPFFSPDGQSIGFFDGEALKKVSAIGGPVVTVTTLKGLGRGGTWGADDSIIFATTDATGLLRVPAVGGEVSVLTRPNPGEDHLFPAVLPGGRAVPVAQPRWPSGWSFSSSFVVSGLSGVGSYGTRTIGEPPRMAFGVPSRLFLTCDGEPLHDIGVPFSSPWALYGLSKLSVLVAAPGHPARTHCTRHPEQNARHERLHLNAQDCPRQRRA